MTPATPETYPDLFFGYTVIWLLIAVFLIILWRAQIRLAKELAALKLGGEPRPHQK